MFGKPSQHDQQRMNRHSSTPSSTARQDFQADHPAYADAQFSSKHDDAYDGNHSSSSMSSTSRASSTLPSPPTNFAGEHFPLARHPLDVSMAGQFPLIRCDTTKSDFDYQRHHQQNFPQFFDCISCTNPTTIGEGYYSSYPPPLLPQEMEFDLRHRVDHPLPHFQVSQNPSSTSMEDYPYYMDFNLLSVHAPGLSSIQNNDLESKNEEKGEYAAFQSGLDSTSGSTVTSGSPGSAPVCQIKTESGNSSSEKNRQEVKTSRGMAGKRKSNLQDSIRKHRRREQNRIAARKCREKKKVQVDSILKGYQRTLKENERLQKEVQELQSLNNKLNDVMSRHQKVCPIAQSADTISVLRDQSTPSTSVSKSSQQFHGAPGYTEPFCEYSPESENISTPPTPRNAFYQP